MTASELAGFFPKERIIWWQENKEEIPYWSAFKAQNIGGAFFWIWLIIIIMGIVAAGFLRSFDFMIFGIFIPLGAYHFHEKTKKAIQEANTVYGLTNKHIFKLTSEADNKLQSYPVSQLSDIQVELQENGKQQVNFILETTTDDFSKNDLKGIVSFKNVSLPEQLIEDLKNGI